MAITNAQETEILKVVAGLFNAAPGGTYLTELANLVEGGMTTSQLADALAANTIFTHGIMGGKVTVDDQVAVLMDNFGVTADSDPASAGSQAEAYFTQQIEAGVGFGKIVYDAGSFLATTTDTAFTTTATLLANKALVAHAYSTTSSSTDLATLQNVLSNVTGTAPYTDDDVAAILEGSGSIGGQSFTLTKSVQALTGTSGNDTFIAGDDGGSAALNAGDSITGGGGTDTLKLFNAAAADNTGSFTSAVISSVENVEATLSASAQTLNVSANADVKKVTLVNGFDGTVTLKAAQTAGLSGGIQTTAAATFAFSDVTGGADTANLELNAADLVTTGAGAGLTIAGVETLNINATGVNLLGPTTLAATTKLVITGAGSVSSTLASALAKTIDGSAATGDLVIDNSAAAAAIESIKTGTGDDTYTTNYANLTADDVIELGDGAVDSLRFADAATFNDTTTQALLTKVTGVEQLGTVSALLTVDGDFVSQTSFYTDGAAGAFALTDVANNTDVAFGAGVILASTVGMKLGANTLDVNLAGSKTAAADVTTGLTVTGSANINVDSSGTDGIADNVLALTAADNQAVVVTGSQDLTLTTTAAVATTGFSIDGSAFTGELTVTGTAATDVVKGGSGEDIISGGAGAIADTLTGNGGADKFIIIAGATSTTFDTITDFVTKSDTIDFTGAVAGSSTNYTEATAAVADFTAALAAANTALDTTVLYNVQQIGSDTYVFADAGATGSATEVVKLTGVALTGVEFGDIVV